ncbi:MAG: lipopolysaccharide biosynthesis protein [Thermoguttaceae bacterium]|nr:lipopolysaccharide biosynthesis protein [Thermoguttaceae bacterium]
MSNPGLAQRSVIAASWVLMIQFFQRFVGIFLGILMARILMPSDYGILGLLAVFWAVCDVFIAGGFGTALIQKKDVTRIEYNTVFYYNMLLSCICCGLMLFAAPWIASFYEQPILVPIIRVTAWTLPISSLVSIQRVMLMRKLEQRVLSLVSLISFAVSGGLGLYLAYHGFGVWTLVWQSVSSTVCNAMLVFLFVRWIPRLEFSLAALRQMFQFGSKLMFSGLLDCVFVNLYNVTIGKIYSTQALGYYERAKSYASLWPTSIQSTISSVLFPAFSQMQDDLPRLKSAFQRALVVSTSVIVFPSLLLCVLSRSFVELLITAKWLPILPFWWMLTFNFLQWPFHVLNLQLLMARGRSDRFLYLEIIKKGLTIVNILSTFRFGLFWMVLGMMVTSSISLYLNSYYTTKEIDFPLRKQLSSCISSLWYAIVSCAVAWGVNWLIYPTQAYRVISTVRSGETITVFQQLHLFQSIAGLLVPVAVGCLFYAVLHWWFQTEVIRTFLDVVESRLPQFDRIWRKLRRPTMVTH